MKMGVKVYYSEISGHKEVKKRQQRIMMILDSKAIPYQPIDITEPGRESDKDFMLSNGKPRGEAKSVFSPQIFYDEDYCGDYDDFDLANENDTLEEFLRCPRIVKNAPAAPNSTNTNGTAGSRENSAEVEKVNESEAPTETPATEASTENAVEEVTAPSEASAGGDAAEEKEGDE